MRLRDVPQFNAERDRAVRGGSAGGLGLVAGRTPAAQRGAGSRPATSEQRTYAPSRPNGDGRSRRWIAGHLFTFIVATAALALASGCGGKSKPAAEPGAASCCCASGDGREIVAETVCDERGGSCEPTETCEATDPSPDGDGSGDSDPDDY